MTGFSFPGERIFNWIRDTIKGRHCLYCGRRLERKKLEPLGTCSWRCVDSRECNVYRKSCGVCIHHRFEKKDPDSGWEVDWCVASGKRQSIPIAESTICVKKSRFDLKGFGR